MRGNNTLAHELRGNDTPCSRCEKNKTIIAELENEIRELKEEIALAKQLLNIEPNVSIADDYVRKFNAM